MFTSIAYAAGNAGGAAQGGPMGAVASYGRSTFVQHE